MENAQGLIVTFAPMIIVLVVFYFLLIRPQKKRQEEIQSMREALQIGDKVLTIGGIRGKLIDVTDDIIILETSLDKTRLEFSKSAVAQVLDSELAVKEENV